LFTHRRSPEVAVRCLGITLESDRLTERHIQNGALSPPLPDRKGVKVHAHHVVFPEPHGKRGELAPHRRPIYCASAKES
jgi:LysR family glycine cleavage system transcriptional activator